MNYGLHDPYVHAILHGSGGSVPNGLGGLKILTFPNLVKKQATYPLLQYVDVHVGPDGTKLWRNVPMY